MKFKLKLLTLAGVFVFMILGGLSCSKSDGTVLGEPKQITLNWWTVFHETDDLRPLIDAYRAIHPNIAINVRRLRLTEFEDALVDALAEDRGPDIFSTRNTEVRKYLSKISPMPASTTLERGIEKGTIKKQIFTQKVTTPSFKQRYLEETFLDQVLTDVQLDGSVYGLPLSMDNLAIYYNKDLLNNAGIAAPAKTYQELSEHVLKLTKQDRLGNIIQSGIALGTDNNVVRYGDILSLLMMQNGTQMASSSGQPLFHRLPAALEGKRTSLPASDALYFYTDFANPSKQVYTCNDKQPSSLEAFMRGKVAYFIGYSYHTATIKAQAPQLNFGISHMLQIEGNTKVNFANYWLEVVTKKSRNKDAAWDFLQFVSKPENVKTYLTRARRPSAVKPLIQSQIEDTELGVFAEQLLTSKSWYKGANPEFADAVFAQMIREIHNGTKTINQILEDAAEKISQTIQ
jgi:multiple sugar transport system substrate-binding protein